MYAIRGELIRSRARLGRRKLAQSPSLTERPIHLSKLVLIVGSQTIKAQDSEVVCVAFQSGVGILVSEVFQARTIDQAWALPKSQLPDLCTTSNSPVLKSKI